MPSIDDVKVKITTDADGKGIDEAERRIAGFSSKAIDASKKVALGIAGIGIAAGAMALSFVKDFSAQEDSIARLKAGLTNVGITTNKLKAGSEQLTTQVRQNSAALLDQASALQKTTRFADEQITSGQAMLTTFQLSSKTIKSLTPSMLDMAEAMRKTSGETVDLNQLGVMFGKVMGNAEGGVEGLSTGLKKLGVIMTDEQAAVFKFGTEAERAAQLTEIMDQNFKGFAEAGGATFSGRMEIMNNQLGEIKESIGGLVAQALSPMVEFISTNAVPAFERFGAFIKEHETLAKALAVTLGVILVAAFAALAVGAVSSLLAITVAGAPVFAIVGAIALAVGALYLAWSENFLGIQTATQIFATWFQNTALPIIKVVFDMVRAIVKSTLDEWVGKFNTAKKAVEEVNNFIKNTFVPEFKKAMDTIGSIVNAMTGGLLGNLIKIVGGFDGITNAIGRLISKLGELANSKLGKIIVDAGGDALRKLVFSALPGFADGVTNFSGGPAIVGENGPELVNLPRGADVVPNDQLGGIRPIQVTQYIQSPVDLDFAMRELAFVLKNS